MNLFTKRPNLPPRASGTEPSLVHPSAWNEMLDYVAALEQIIRSIHPRSSPDILAKTISGGTSYSLARRGKDVPVAPCPFGRLTTWLDGSTTITGIRGGAVTAGPNVFDVDNLAIDLDTPATFLVWLETAVTANEEDGLLLPGLSASVQTTMETGSSYPSQTIPTIASSGEGTSIVPLGSVTVAASVARFSPSACGDVTINHCPGALSYTRG